MKVAILMGGWSAEREVSLVTGAKGVTEAVTHGWGMRPIPYRHGPRCRAAACRSAARCRVQRASRHAGRGRVGAGTARSDGPPLYTHSGRNHIGYFY